MQKYEHRNGKKKNQNQKKDANLGIIKIVNNGRQDDQKRYSDHNNSNQNSNQNSYYDVTADRKYNQRRYNNQDKYGKKNRWENRNTHDKQDTREDFQNRRDFQNKQSDIRNRRDFQSRQGDMNKLLSIQRNHENPTGAHKWRVVCDSMLGGLSSRLRMCGVDCVHVLFDQGGEDSAKLARHENRVLLTRNKNYEKVRYILY